MLDLSSKLKKYLESEYSMPFCVDYSFFNGTSNYVCWPENEGAEFFQMKVFVKNGIRLVLEITPQKHAAAMVNDMGCATETKKACFFEYIDSLRQQGAKVEFTVNGTQKIITLNDWPDSWHNFDCKISMLPIPEINDVNDEFVIISDWLSHGVNLIFSLLTIKDIDIDYNELVERKEGTQTETQSVRYERNPIFRRICLLRKGYNCAVCGMNFHDTYGEIGKNYIEVHHTTPVSMMGPNYQFDVDKDLVPLCSNCHSMAHRRNPPYSVVELKSFLKK